MTMEEYVNKVKGLIDHIILACDHWSARGR